ncbi:hypothetical protein, partial [Staphylococcus aureus]|uniref:hypothetical protein n=1 Tax=Staphylococcus aureus TaxID=1280 RepID=UPI000B2539FE
ARGSIPEAEAELAGLKARIAAAPAEALAGMPVGNANGSSFINCEALRNGRHGFHLRGNNANACVLLGCRSPSNGAWGFCDDSLLGNSYLGCEADSNDEGGYYSNPDKPIRSTYLGCYSETETHFSIGALCTIAGSQGLYKPGRASGGIGLSGLPIGAAYLTQQLVIAASDDVANALGHAPYAGKMIAVGDEGIVYRATAASPYVK